MTKSLQAAITKISNTNNVLYFYITCECPRPRSYPHIHPKTLQTLIQNKLLVRRPNQYDWYDLKVGA